MQQRLCSSTWLTHPVLAGCQELADLQEHPSRLQRQGHPHASRETTDMARSQAGEEPAQTALGYWQHDPVCSHSNAPGRTARSYSPHLPPFLRSLPGAGRQARCLSLPLSLSKAGNTFQAIWAWLLRPLSQNISLNLVDRSHWEKLDRLVLS